MKKKNIDRSIYANIAKLVTGTVLSQIINILVSPILSRMYSPADFGVSVLFQSITNIILTIATLKLDSAIVIPESDEKAKRIVVASLFYTFVTSIIMFIILLMLHIFGLDIFKNGNKYLLYFLVSLTILFGGTNSTFSNWGNRIQEYKTIMWIPVINTVTSTILNLSFGFLNYKSYGLIFGIFGGTLISSLYLFLKFGIPKIEPNIVKTTKEFSDFPIFQMPALLLNTLSTQIAIVAFTFFYNDTITGWYSMSQRILLLPLTIVGSAVGQVYFREAVSLNQRGEKLDVLTKKILTNAFLIAFIPMTIIIGFGDVLFGFVFGKEWVEAGIFAKYLTPWFLMVFVASPLSNILIVLKRQRENLIINFILLLSRVLVIWLGSLLFKDYSSTLILFGGLGFILWYLLSIYFVRLANVCVWKYIAVTMIYFAMLVVPINYIRKLLFY